MSVAVIEIDPSARWPPDDVDRPPRDRRMVRVVAVFVAVLLILSGAWVGQPGGLWLRWRADVVGGYFWLTPEAAYAVERDGSGISLVRRDLAEGAVAWRVPLTGPLARSYADPSRAMVTQFPPSLNLDTVTMVIDTRSGGVVRAYPTSAMPLVYLAGDVAITVDRDPAAGPDPPLPALSLTETGRDRRHLVVARELATGEVRWTRPLPAGVSWSFPGVPVGAEGIVGLSPGQGWLVTSDNDGVVDTWDVRTGAKLATLDVGPLGIDSYVAALESTVVVRHRGTDKIVMTAYDPRTLVQTWRTNPPAIHAYPFECGDLLCLQTDWAVWATDRVRGGLAWRLDVARLRPSLDPAAMLVTGFGESLALIDPAGGRFRIADVRWQVVDLNRIGSAVVVARPNGSGGAALGLLNPVDGSLTRIGEIGAYSPATQCVAVPGHVACEDGNLLRLYGL